MKRAALLVLLLAGPVHAAITLDTTTCTAGSVTACPIEHITNTGVYTGGTATVNFPTSISCGAAGTLLIAVVLDEAHGGSPATSTGVPVITAGNPANYSLTWTLATGSSTSGINGGAATYYARCSGAFSGEVPKLTVTCSGGTNICSTGTAAGAQESHVLVYGFSAAFATPGNATANNSAAFTPSATLTTTAAGGDKVILGWSDFSGSACTQTLTANAQLVDSWATIGTVPSPCNSGNSDYYVGEWITTLTTGTPTIIGTSAPTTALGAWTAIEVCDSTAVSCPNTAAATRVLNRLRSFFGVGR